MPSLFLSGFEKLVTDRADAPAVFALSEDRVLSFGDIAREYQQMTSVFAGAKIPEGSCVIALAGNNASWFSLFLTCIARGDTLLSLDDDIKVEEAERIASRYAAVAVVAPASRHDLRHELSPALPGELVLTRRQPREPKSFEPARLLKLTSGSSGEPKAVRVTEENLWNDARHIVDAMAIGEKDVNYGVIPLAHSYGLGNLVAPLFLQGTPIALRRMFVPGLLFDDVAETGATILPGVPFLFQKILAQYGNVGLPPSVRLLVTAGASIEPDLVSSFKERLGMKIHSFYGSSETGGITYDDDNDLTEPLNVGKAMPHTEVSFRSDPRAPSGERRIHVRGNAVALGYVEAPDDESLAEFVDDGFATGDLGRLDECGRLYLTGRLTSFVNVAGRKVDPREAERVLMEMPEIADAKVVGRPCDKRGQKLVAFVVPASGVGTLGQMQVRNHCAKKLSAHKIPRDVIVVDAMPVTPRGKLDRKALFALVAESDTPSAL
jgi:long-chain acyl-CoA synthetase